MARVEISRRSTPSGSTYYIVHAPSGSRRFENLDEARDTAKAASEDAALKEARARGALGQLAVRTQVKKLSALTSWGSGVDMGYTVESEVTARFGEEY